MEQRDVTTMNSHSGNYNSSPSSYGPSPSLSDSILSNKAETSMEQRDVSTMNSHSANNPSPPPSYGPSPSLSDSIFSSKAETTTSTLNPSENPILEPTNTNSTPRSDEAQTSSSSNPPPISSQSAPIKSSQSQSQSQPQNASGVSNPKSASDYNDDDDEIPISSMSNPGTATATQNPPVQMMDRGAEEPGTPSAYRIPSHVFDRSKSNTPEWSAASNESLFSIHVGNMSFSRELNWVNEMNMPSPLPPSPLPPPSPTPPIQCPMNNKFNDISQSAKEFNEGLEAKAAETMREVIMETTTEDQNYHDLTSVSVTARDGVAGCGGGFGNFHDHSRHSDGSTKSFAFKVRTDGDKSPTARSPKGVKEKAMAQEMQTMTETETESETATTTSTTGTSNETPKNATQTPKAPTTSNAPACSKWLCCFPCCK